MDGGAERRLTIAYLQYDLPGALPSAWGELYRRALEATQGSYAPYSSFCVGAAVELHDGRVVLGSNQENVAYPSGMCAERVALFHAGALYPTQPIRRIALVAQQDGEVITSPLFPCGACCQVLLEYAKRSPEQVGVLMASAWECIVLEDARMLLPFAFTSFGSKG